MKQSKTSKTRPGGTVVMPAKDDDHQRLAEALVREAHANNGLAPVDLPRFWADQDVSARDPFGAQIAQVPIEGCMATPECLFAELGVPEDWHRHAHDRAWVVQLSKAYNDKAEPIIGRRPLNEDPGDPTRAYPATAGLAGLFEAKKVWHNESYWLMPSANTEDELKSLLDRVEARLTDLRAHLLPPDWDQEKRRLMALGVKPPAYRGQRGPVTFATSVYGIENLIYLIADNPDLARRFSRLILEAMQGLARVMDEEAGHTPETAPRGFWFCDDNCCLLTPEMYELFGYPVLKGIFERFCPKPGDSRYQHSDSAMGHLLPILGRLNLTGVNFGPTLTVTEIREHLPHAVVYGQLAPFTYSRNDEVGIVREFLRDFEQARAKRGLVFTTAGSINNGSRLTGARLIMAAVQRYGRYA